MQALADREAAHREEVGELQQELLIQQQAAKELQAAMQMKLDEEIALLGRLAISKPIIMTLGLPTLMTFPVL